MYSRYDLSSKVNLWCEGKAKNENDENEMSPVSKKTSREAVDRKDQIDTIFHQIQEKHPKMDTPKLHPLAKLVQTHCHESYDEPPQIPLITWSATASKSTW